MYRSSLVSFDFPRPEDSINLAARALKKYKNASLTLAMREEGLQEAKRYLPGCVRGDEIRSLQRLGVLKCTAPSFNKEIEVPCEGTCGTNLTKFVIPAFSLISTFLLLNLSAAIMIESLKTAYRFSGAHLYDENWAELMNSSCDV